MKSWAAVALAVLVLTPGAEAAGPLAPAVPSELVTLQSSGSTAPCPFGGTALDRRIGADSTFTVFTVPLGQVFVVTGVSWVVPLGGFAGMNALVDLSLQTSTISNHVLFDSVVLDFAGSGAKSTLMTNAFAVKPGVGFCVDSNVSSITVRVYGYLAADK